MQPSIYLRTGPQSGTKFVLEGKCITVGRGVGNQIQIADREISRRHLEFIQEAAGIWLRDLGSDNGTHLNGQLVHWAQLQTGDVIRIGQTEILFTGGASTGLPASLPVSVQLMSSSSADSTGSTTSDFIPPNGSKGGLTAGGLNEPMPLMQRSDLEFVYQAFQTLGLGLDFQALANQILELIFGWIQVDRGCILLHDSGANELVVTAAKIRGPSDDSRIRVSRSILHYVLREQIGVLTPNAREDERWDDTDTVIEAGVHEAICVPLRGRDDVLGVLYVDTFRHPQATFNPRGRVLTAEHLQIMLTVGCLTALAVENARYHQELLARERLSAIGETIASLSHHIKNILQGLNSGTYLLEEGLKQETRAETRRGWEIVKRYQDQIAKLVTDMLSYSRERVPQLNKTDLNRTVADCVVLNRAKASQAGVELEWLPFAKEAVWEYDPYGLSHAINNLIQNGIEACEGRNGSKVTVAVGRDREQDGYFVAVQDNGPGISSSELEQIFQLFHSTKGSRGTGLGLAVSRKIIEEHGGELTVESRLGAGSKFTIRLLDMDLGEKSPRTFPGSAPKSRSSQAGEHPSKPALQ